jgi:hypothetical protein
MDAAADAQQEEAECGKRVRPGPVDIRMTLKTSLSAPRRRHFAGVDAIRGQARKRREYFGNSSKPSQFAATTPNRIPAQLLYLHQSSHSPMESMMQRKTMLTAIVTIALASSVLSHAAFARGGSGGHVGGGAHIGAGGFGGAHVGGSHFGGPVGPHARFGEWPFGGAMHLNNISGAHLGADHIAPGPAAERVAHFGRRDHHRRALGLGYYDTCDLPYYAETEPYCDMLQQ